MHNAIDRSSTRRGDSQTENEAEKHRQAAATIYDTTNACFDIFERLISIEGENAFLDPAMVSEADSSDESPCGVKGRLNNFAFWIDYTGALAPVGESLDDRLQENDEIVEMVLELLHMIHRNLRRLEHNVDGNQIFSTPARKKCLYAIDSALDRLHFLGKAIRKSSVRTEDQGLLNFESEDDRFFHSMAVSYVKLTCPNARPSLRSHIADIIAKRRQILLQKYRHAKRLKIRRAPESSHVHVSEQYAGPSVKQEAANLRLQGDESQPTLSAVDSRATKASMLDKRVVMQHIHQKPTHSVRSSGSSQRGVSALAEYPNPPPITPGERYVPCTYCLEPLQAQRMRLEANHEYWRRHVDQDLQPYVCLFRHCSDPCFAHRADWKAHMATAHSQDWPSKVHSTTWHCDLDHQEPAKFDNETDWREHMKDISLHSSRSKPPTEAQLKVLAVRKQVLARRAPLVCPFCEDVPPQIAHLGDRGNSTDMKEFLLEHISDHMLSLSFLSLPSLLDDAAEAKREKRSTFPNDSSIRWVRSLGLLPQPPSGVGVLEDISVTFDNYISESEFRAHEESKVTGHATSHATRCCYCKTTTRRLFTCIQCNRQEFCDECWSQWALHAPGALGFDGRPHQKSDPRPGVAETYPDFIDKASENDTDSDAEISVPETDGDFAWEFSARSEVPFGDVDVALEKWTEERVSHTANYFVVPYAKNNDFVGRRNILHQLKSQLNRSQSQADSIPNANAFLFGERGIGKTQIALAYVYGLQNTQPEVSVFWVNAHDTQSFRQAYASIAQETQIPGRDDPTLNLLSLVQEWLERGPLRSWLMVIDGVEGEQPHGQIGPLSRFIPRSAHGSILVTTRKFQLGQTLTTEGTPIEVGKLDVDESKLLLRERLEGYDFDPDDLPPTTLRVGHKPLALIQAAASLQRRAVSLSDFPQLIQQYDLETAAEEFKKQNKELPERRLGEEHHGTLLSMVSLTRPRHRGDFEIAVVCALPLEYDAATLAFDEFWDEDGDMFGIAPNDPNSYTTGRIGQLNVVLALLPNMGKASSSGAAAALRSSYYGLKLAILAGICGGVPGSGDELDEMILGDVVISRSVFQFDLGSQYTDTFSRKDTIHDNLGRSNHGIRSLLAIYESDFGRGRLEYGSAEILEKIQKKAVNERRRARYGRPAPSEDSLFKSTYLHLHQNWEETGCGCSNRGGCDQAARTSCRELGCDEGHLVPRDRLTDSETQSPQIFIGNVASGDTVMKSGDHRDKLAQQHGIIAFETEGAGIWDQIPCIIVKGVCDYADSHRNKKWQPYAAVAAASVTKALLERYIQEDKPRAFQSSSSSGRVAQQFTDTGSGTQNNNSGEGKQ